MATPRTASGCACRFCCRRASTLRRTRPGSTPFRNGRISAYPFAGHSHDATARNIYTEAIVVMAHDMGIETVIDLEALIETS